MVKFHRDSKRPIDPAHWIIGDMVSSLAIELVKHKIPEADHEEVFDMLAHMFTDLSEHARAHHAGEHCPACNKAKSN